MGALVDVALSVLGGATVFIGAGLSLERNIGWFWALAAILSAIVGFRLARRSGAVPVKALFGAFAIFMGLAGAAAWWFGDGGGLASAPVRALLLSPAVLTLCGYFGLSLGYLYSVREYRPRGGKSHLAGLFSGYEGFLARRFMLSNASPVLSMVTGISVLGVALGVWLVTVSLGILSGFEGDLRRKIIGTEAHAVLTTSNEDVFDWQNKYEMLLTQQTGVVAVSPFVSTEVGVASRANYSGVKLVGVDPKRSNLVLDVFKGIETGEAWASSKLPAPSARSSLLQDEKQPGHPSHKAEIARFTPPTPLPGVVVGVELARSLNVHVGDIIRVVSPSAQVLTPVGPIPRSQGFKVDAVFSSKMYEFDARLAYTTLAAARRFMGIGQNAVTGAQVRLDDPEDAPTIAPLLGRVLRNAGAAKSIVARDWRSRNQSLFAALQLERAVAFVVLAFIILVASFSVANTLAMAIVEKQAEIAILKTIGAPKQEIMKLFLFQGLLVGGIGTVIGAICGVATLLGLQRFNLWIPDEVYYIDALPVEMEPVDVVVVVIAALLIVWDFAVMPALRGAQLEPARGLREG